MYSKLTLLTAFALLAGTGWAADEIRFGRDIRPLLSDRCFACHGPNEEDREGGFQLDQKESALGEADSGERVIVPYDLEQSELYRRIVAEDESERMPPPDSNKTLTKEETELIGNWIEQGAAWEGHWSYTPPTRPVPPVVGDSAWPQNDVDKFVLARLEREGLAPSPEADRVTLLRRVTLDLTGLPPTIAEVAAFLADESPSAYENVVDRLLRSPRYGEHEARYWLDAARYGDTHGLHLDNYREMWPYRDWVVNAFNENKPFDQFVVEQLAGDLLPDATVDQLIATGFIRCHVTTNEGGSIKEEVYVRNVVDRVVTFGTVFMGATFDCTRCHDHKFDPYTMKDFYALFAYFNSLDGNPMDGNKKNHEPVIRVATAEQRQLLADYEQQIDALEARLEDRWPVVDEAQQAWEEALSHEQQVALDDPQEGWQVLDPETFVSKGKADLKKLDDNSLLASGTNPAKEVYEVISRIRGEGWQAIRLEGLIDESLTKGGAGRSANSNVVLTELEAYVAADADPPAWKKIAFQEAWADHEQPNGDFHIGNAIDGNPNSGWAIEGHVKKEDRTAFFVADTAFGATDEVLLKVVLKHESVYGQHQFGRFRLSVCRHNPIPTDIPPAILKIVRTPPAERTDNQQADLRSYYRDAVAEEATLVAARNELAALRKSQDDLTKALPTTLIYREKAEPRESFVLFRGEYDQQRESVERRTPAALPPLNPELPNSRLGLAQWLVDPAHPLTARVAVNRFWQQLFGTGIVKTAADFGSQGEPPSHPLLLDWLAVDFVESGWDVKQLLKTIVLSATYRQSAHVTAELAERDPDNRRLARGPRFRLDAEVLRDQALYVSGLLSEKMGGPSVKPPQPAGLWFAVGYTRSDTAKFVADEGPDKVHRRTLYTFIKRTAPPPEMSTFDAPSRESSCVRRERTNTPLQALLLFNDPQYVEAARGLATRTINEGGDSVESRAAYMFRLCTCRLPTDEEQKDLVAGYREDLAAYQAAPDTAQQLISVGAAPTANSLDPCEVAAWTMAANLLLNLDEVVTR